MSGEERDPDPSCTAVAIWRLLGSLSHQFRAGFDQVLSEFGLSEPQAELVRVLAMESPLLQREAARRLRCDPSNITGLADQLESRGLVERRVQQGDRRLRPLALTAAGHDLWTGLLRRVGEPPEAITRLSEEDQLRLRDVLQQVADSGPDRVTRPAEARSV